MSSFTPAESLHRLVKEALDSGAAASLGEANSMFRSFRVCFSITAASERRAHVIIFRVNSFLTSS